jgi:hypothetical protein
MTKMVGVSLWAAAGMMALGGQVAASACEHSENASPISANVATVVAPGRVPVPPWRGGEMGPRLLTVKLGPPRGLKEPSLLTAHIALLVLSETGEVSRRVPIRPITFYGAQPGEPSSYSFDLARLGLTDIERAGLLTGRAAVEVEISGGAAIRDASVPLLSATLG